MLSSFASADPDCWAALNLKVIWNRGKVRSRIAWIGLKWMLLNNSTQNFNGKTKRWQTWATFHLSFEFKWIVSSILLQQFIAGLLSNFRSHYFILAEWINMHPTIFHLIKTNDNICIWMPSFVIPTIFLLVHHFPFFHHRTQRNCSYFICDIHENRYEKIPWKKMLRCTFELQLCEKLPLGMTFVAFCFLHSLWKRIAFPQLFQSSF